MFVGERADIPVAFRLFICCPVLMYWPGIHIEYTGVDCLTALSGYLQDGKDVVDRLRNGLCQYDGCEFSPVGG